MIAIHPATFATTKEQQHTPTTTTAIPIATYVVKQEAPRIPTIPLIHTTLIPTGKLARFAVTREPPHLTHIPMLATQPATPANTQEPLHTLGEHTKPVIL